MSPTHRFIDAQGLACPEPLILARKALAEGGFDLLEILVDNAAARENLLKYAAYAHCPVEGVAVEGGRTRIRLLPAPPKYRAARADASRNSIIAVGPEALAQGTCRCGS